MINEKYKPLSVYIRIEDKVTWLEASGYSLIMMLSEIGGLASFCYAFSRVCTRKIARNWFIGTMIQQLFRVRSPNSSQSRRELRNLARQITSNSTV